MSADVLQLQCLGKPFQLGMLYDRCRDHLITEMTLWDSEILSKSSSCSKKLTCEHSYLEPDTLDSQYSFLGISEELKLSHLIGLTKVSGSASYLNYCTSVPHLARYCLKYSSNTKCEQLSAEHLQGKKMSWNVQGIQATHVVTGVSYGADAIFVFDHIVENLDEKPKKMDALKTIVENIPYTYINTEGKIKVNLKEIDEESIRNINCKLYADVHINNPPNTYRDAIHLYQQFVSSKGENSVPKKVWLHPLHNFHDKVEKSYVNIDVQSLSVIQSVIEKLISLDLQIKRVNKSTENFTIFQTELNTFATHLTKYKMTFLQKVAMIVPDIRRHKKDESELAELLKTYENSAFATTELEQWLVNKSSEIKAFGKYLQILKEVDCAFSPDLEDDIETCSIGCDYVVCLEFNVCGGHDKYLEQLRNFNQNKRTISINSTQPWHRSSDIKRLITSQVKVFKNFYESNKCKTSPNIKFLLTHNNDEQIETEGAIIWLYDSESDDERERFNAPGKCSKPKLIHVSHNSIEIEWQKPENGADAIKYYTVYYSENVEIDAWMEKKTSDTATTTTLNQLKSNTSYVCKVCANWKLGLSIESDLSDKLTTTLGISNAAAVFKELSKCTKVGNPSEYELPLKLMRASDQLSDNDGDDDNDDKGSDKKDSSVGESHSADDDAKTNDNDDNTTSVASKDDSADSKIDDDIVLARYLVGESAVFHTPGTEKVLMIVGATGAGKTTLINSMVNYLLGVNYDDDFRFKLVSEHFNKSQAHSQTSRITSYTIYTMNGFKLPHTLTIVDTPGYGDTQGLERDKLITKKIRKFFLNSDKYGVDHLDGIGFVVQSALARLTPSQRYIFDSVLALFGNDVEENIFIMVTFSDAERPPVLNAVSEAKIKYSTYYQFNNSAVFLEKSDENKNFGKLFWGMGTDSFEKFFKSFLKSKPVSLSLTQQVLDERKKLDATIYGIQKQIEKGVAKIEEVEKEKNILLKHQAKIDANVKFTYEITVTKQRRDVLSPGTYVTNCSFCHNTCHFPCYIADDRKKFECWAMDRSSGKDAKCRICKHRCSWDHHFNNGYKFEFYDATETRTSDELKKKYEEGISGKATAEKLIKNMADKIIVMRKEILEKMKVVQNCLQVLDKIALKPNALTEVSYLEMLIESENDQKNPGYMGRIKFYRQALADAQVVLIAKGSKEETVTSKKYERVMKFSKLDAKNK